MMQSCDISDALLSKIRERFDTDPKVRQLYVKQDLAKRSGHFREALEIGKAIDELYSRVVYNYVKEAEDMADEVGIDDMKVSEDVKERILSLSLVVFMAADIIESAVMDINSVIRKYDEDLKFVMFDDIREISSMAKEKLKYLRAKSTYMDDLFWADKCDNMYEMMQSKARSIVRKRKDNPDWGKNK